MDEGGIYLTRYPAKFRADAARAELSRLQDEIVESLIAVTCRESQMRSERDRFDTLYRECPPKDRPEFKSLLADRLKLERANLREQEQRAMELKARAECVPEVHRFPLDLADCTFLCEC